MRSRPDARLGGRFWRGLRGALRSALSGPKRLARQAMRTRKRVACSVRSRALRQQHVRLARTCTNNGAARRVLLIGHDAHPHGAQMLLLNMARVMQQELHFQVDVLLKQGGPLLNEYQAIAQTSVLSERTTNTMTHILSGTHGRAARGSTAVPAYDLVICNTCVTGDLVLEARALGSQVVSLVHELPNLIREYRLTGSVRDIARHADHVVFASEHVQAGFHTFVHQVKAREHLRPQGLYKPVLYSETDRSTLRDSLGVRPEQKLVLNVGCADLRKGFDTFLHTAKWMISQRQDVHFAWVGTLAGELKHWLFDEAALPELGDRLHLPGFSRSPEPWYSAADAFFLSSREDPYPSVVLEAMGVGLPVVGFRGCTGLDALLATHGELVSQADPMALVAALKACLDDDQPQARAARIAYVSQHARFDRYCADMCALGEVSEPHVVY